MQKEIKYTGITTRPGDHDCPDGDLRILMNLVNEDGNIKPIEKPAVLFSIPDGYDIIHIHDNKTYRNYILYRINEAGHPEISYSQLSSGLLSTPIVISELDSFIEAKSIGNILIILSSGCINYALYSEGVYNYLGNEIPCPNIYFSTMYIREGTLNTGLVDGLTIPFIGYSGDQDFILEDGSIKLADDYQDDVNTVTNAVIGSINKKVTELHKDGYFVHPFFIRYAIRLYDGSLTKISAPILLFPTFSGISTQIYAGSSTDNRTGAVSSYTLNEIYVAIKKGTLIYHINPDDQLTKWKDIISSIDVFASAPIYTYDQSKSTVAVCNIDYLSYYYDSKIISSFTKVSGSGTDIGPNLLLIPFIKPQKTIDNLASTSTFYKIASFSIDDAERGHQADDEVVSGSILVSYLSDEGPRETTSPEGYPMYKLKPEYLNTLEEQEVMPDDFRTNDVISAEGSFIYNNRINIYNISTILKGFNPKRYNTKYLINQAGRTAISVYVKKDDGQTAVVTTSVENTICPFPLFFFYPEANAYKVIFENAGKIIEKELKTHNTLNGAYYLGNTLKNEEITIIGTAPVESNTIIYAPNQIKLSEVDNPFLFKAVNSYLVGSGEVLSISSATKALSQGQFGQFPLYAFSSDGVWALEVSSTGTYSVTQPATRDVINGKTVLQLDGALAFITDQGIMLLSGSESQCISIIIDQEIKNITLPQLGSILNIPEIVPFKEFSAGCSMAFDYVHSRLLVFNPTYSYSYVYSMKSKTWSIINETFSGSINSYPDSYLKKGNTIVNLASDNEIISDGVIVSRPMKLDSEGLKTITQAIHRGSFNNGNVQTILYGSRDLINYSVVTSSANHKMNAHGSPYKYYVIVIKSTLTVGEHISGTSILVEEKFNNKLR
ncbi:hypothetical protein [uncultured Bacteroides sp.]|uniref:hypothetical protein n=1 Tax=uncultured Bacteroides sp. TaxID=162156 RepID=UPI002AA93E8A|nr:hypothetical protein [uncultured Bacteroides sp.]